MKYIFPALKTRWDQSAELKRLGGSLHLADEGQSARPNTSVHGRMTPMDTFGSDIEQWSIEFRLHGRGSASRDALDWYEAMRGWFHRATLSASAAAVMVMNLEPSDGEDLRDGIFDSAISFVCYFQRNAPLPVTSA